MTSMIASDESRVNSYGPRFRWSAEVRRFSANRVMCVTGRPRLLAGPFAGIPGIDPKMTCQGVIYRAGLTEASKRYISS